MARKKAPVISLEEHPAWRNPDASWEDTEDLRSKCPHAALSQCGGNVFDVTSPTLMTLWIGCSDCGKLQHFHRLGKPDKQRDATTRGNAVRRYVSPEYAVVLMNAGIISRDEARLVALV